MNKLTIIGNITHDAELRQVNGVNGLTSVCSFSVAVNRRQGRNSQQPAQVDYFRCTLWDKRAEGLARYLTKGQKVAVTGAVSVRTYQAQDGTTRATLEVQVDDFEFCSSRNDGAAPAPAGMAPAPAAAPMAQASGFTVVEDEDLPF